MALKAGGFRIRFKEARSLRSPTALLHSAYPPFVFRVMTHDIDCPPLPFQNSKESLIASSDVVGCDVTGSRSIFNCDSGGGGGGKGDATDLTRPSSTSAAQLQNDGSGIGEGEGQQRETHSCPSSPTETDCSSGFSTLRRRSVTLTEKVKVYELYARPG